MCGENHDGHQYIPAVLEAGASAVMVSHEGAWKDKAEELGVPAIMVDDTVYAMGELAKYYLGTLDIKKVAVTGSVGKTSVRDMTYYVLSEKVQLRAQYEELQQRNRTSAFYTFSLTTALKQQSWRWG